MKILFPDFSDITGLPNDDSLLLDQHRMLFFGDAHDWLICQQAMSAQFLDYLQHGLELSVPNLLVTGIDRPYQLHETLQPRQLPQALRSRHQLHLLPLMGNAGAHRFAQALRQAGHAVYVEAPDYATFLQLNQKLGFRAVIAALFGEHKLARGCDLQQPGAAEQLWQTSRATQFVLKPNQSTGGFANQVVAHVGELSAHAAQLQGMDLLEEMIPEVVASLSVHIHVAADGRCTLLPLAEQVMAGPAAANGIAYPVALSAATRAALHADLAVFCGYLASVTYRGNCNLDIVVDAAGRHYFIEANARLAAGAVPRAVLSRLFDGCLPAYRFVERKLPGLHRCQEADVLHASLATLDMGRRSGTLVVQSQKLAFDKLAYVCFGDDAAAVSEQEQGFLNALQQPELAQVA